MRAKSSASEARVPRAARAGAVMKSQRPKKPPKNERIPPHWVLGKTGSPRVGERLPTAKPFVVHEEERALREATKVLRTQGFSEASAPKLARVILDDLGWRDGQEVPRKKYYEKLEFKTKLAIQAARDAASVSESEETAADFVRDLHSMYDLESLCNVSRMLAAELAGSREPPARESEAFKKAALAHRDYPEHVSGALKLFAAFNDFKRRIKQETGKEDSYAPGVGSIVDDYVSAARAAGMEPHHFFINALAHGLSFAGARILVEQTTGKLKLRELESLVEDGTITAENALESLQRIFDARKAGVSFNLASYLRLCGKHGAGASELSPHAARPETVEEALRHAAWHSVQPSDYARFFREAQAASANPNGFRLEQFVDFTHSFHPARVAEFVRLNINPTPGEFAALSFLQKRFPRLTAPKLVQAMRDYCACAGSAGSEGGKRFLSVALKAEEKGVPRATVLRLVQSGVLPLTSAGSRVGPQHFVFHHKVEATAQANEIAGVEHSLVRDLFPNTAPVSKALAALRLNALLARKKVGAASCVLIVRVLLQSFGAEKLGEAGEKSFWLKMGEGKATEIGLRLFAQGEDAAAYDWLNFVDSMRVPSKKRAGAKTLPSSAAVGEREPPKTTPLSVDDKVAWLAGEVKKLYGGVLPRGVTHADVACGLRAFLVSGEGGRTTTKTPDSEIKLRSRSRLGDKWPAVLDFLVREKLVAEASSSTGDVTKYGIVVPSHRGFRVLSPKAKRLYALSLVWYRK